MLAQEPAASHGRHKFIISYMAVRLHVAGQGGDAGVKSVNYFWFSRINGAVPHVSMEMLHAVKYASPRCRQL